MRVKSEPTSRLTLTAFDRAHSSCPTFTYSHWPHTQSVQPSPSHFASFEKLLRDPESELVHFIEAGPSDDDQAGYLYAFLSDEVPDAIKVGFSKPERIDKRLSEHLACYHEIQKIMDPVNMRLEKLAENSVKSILRHFGEELKVDCPSGKHDQHREWFKARSGVGLGEWRDTVIAAIDWVSRNKSTGGRDEKR